MRTGIFGIAAGLTLLADAYLGLALLASSKIEPAYHWALPPFGLEGVRSTPAPVVLAVLAWTAFLAVGCLSRPEPPCADSRDVQARTGKTPGT
jgi:hypothetical protein